MSEDYTYTKRIEISSTSQGLMELAKRDYHLEWEKVEAFDLYKIALKGQEELNSLNNIWKDVFVDPILEKGRESDQGEMPHAVVEISFLPGVTDNRGKSAEDALAIFDLDSRVFSGRLLQIYGDVQKEQIKEMAHKHLANALIQNIQVYTGEEFKKIQRFEKIDLPLVKITPHEDYETIDLTLSMDKLMEMNKKNCWALSEEELTHIISFYQDKKNTEKRSKVGLPAMPTDLEIEVIAQTWSEHCKHKIFSAQIDYSEETKEGHLLGNKQVNGLYPSYIKKSTKEISARPGKDWTISVFSDNAGIVRFDPKVDLCIKVETHNSPSALDPYGGALTGILGVNRDIMGCGLGAKPIANTDVFCFASTSWPLPGEESLMPQGLMRPMRLLKGVHKGIEDGGNKSGIPTINGSIFFDEDFAGKPLVFCGTVGVLPPKLPDGRDTAIKIPNVGDFVVMVGGAIGADGIHGATFSSLELDESSPATAVQIGDPLTQKRAMDFLLEARDRGLYSSLTDNGAGGLSSSVGEMATMTDGATLDLKKCPTKYPGLTPWELMISESQERMTIAVPQDKWKEFLALSNQYGVSSSALGEFTNTGFLEVFYGEKRYGHLDLHFIHESLPQMRLKATWNGAQKRKTWLDRDRRVALPKTITPEWWSEMSLALLNRENIASKKPWVSQFDHEVQGATHTKPFVGKNQDSPSDSGVIWLKPHGGSDHGGISVGHGLAPRMSLVDPYLMAQYSADEAMRNVVATGGDPEKVCMLDNFCWPDPVASAKNPDGEYKLAQLVRTCEGLYDICLSYGAPLVSGKDSMKNDFRGKNIQGDDIVISIQPTLLVTAMASTDIRYGAQSAISKSDNVLYLLGPAGKSLVESELAQMVVVESGKIQAMDLKKNFERYKKIHSALKNGIIDSIHDISDGGLLCALAESLFDGEFGAEIKLPQALTENEVMSFLYSEDPGRFVVSCSPENKKAFEEHFGNDLTFLGKVTPFDHLSIENLFQIPVADAKKSWQRNWEAH
jgi:phosphoribosylformylglycinamidine synthase subunit PurSL